MPAGKFAPGHCGSCGCGPGCPPCAACPGFTWTDGGGTHNMSCYPNMVANFVNGQTGGGTVLLSPSATTACVYISTCATGKPFVLIWDATLALPTLTVRYYPSGCGGSYVTCGPTNPTPSTYYCEGTGGFSFQYDYTLASCHDMVVAGYTQFTVNN